MHGTIANSWIALPHVRIGDQPVAIASRAELTDAMAHDCAKARETGFSRPPRLVFAANGHALSLRHRDAVYRDAMEQADVVHADGGFLIPISKRLFATPIAERSATTDLIHDFAARAERDGLSFYLLGGTEAASAICAAELVRLYPRLNIVGRRNGYFTADDEAGVVAEINATRPDVLWVGLGKPVEQFFAVRHADTLRAGWLVTCGGCYNYITGEYKRAPKWMQRANLEWLHRMVTKPRQLFWRYLTTTPHALWLAISRR